MLSEEDTAWISSLTVAKLKDELKRRSLPVSGLKAELAARLTEALESEKKEEKPAEDDLKDASAEQQRPAAETNEQAEAEQKEVEEADERKKEVEDGSKVETEAKPADNDEKHEDISAADHGSNQQPVQDDNKGAAATGASKSAKPADRKQKQAAPKSTEEGTSDKAAEPAASEEVDYGTEDEHHVDVAEQDVDSRKQVEQKPASTQTDNNARQEQKAKAIDKQEQKPHEPIKDVQAASKQKISNDKPTEEATAGKRRREPIQFQPKAKTPAAQPADTPDTAVAKPSAPATNDQGLETAPSAGTAVQAAADTKPASQQEPASDAQQVDMSSEPGSRAIRIDNLVRPFTENSLRALISQTGSITDLWMPSIKTHAFVILETDEQGAATKRALDGIQWPEASHKRLAVTFLSVEEAEYGILVGRDPSKARPAGGRVSGSGLRTAQSLDASKPRVSGAAAARAAVAAAVAGAGDERSTLKRGRPNDQEAQETAADDDVERAAKRTKTAEEETVAGADAAPAGDVVMADQQQAEEEEEAVLSLDQLFRKTETKPHLYWLPLTEEQIKEKKERLAKEEELRAQGIHPMDPTSPSHHHPEHNNGMHPEPFHRPPFGARQGAGPMERAYPPYRDQHGPPRYGNGGGGGMGGYQGRGYGGPPRFRR